MGFKLSLVSTVKEVDWIKKHYNPKEVIYIGDGIFGHYVMKKMGYSIATKNADNNAREICRIILQNEMGPEELLLKLVCI